MDQMLYAMREADRLGEVEDAKRIAEMIRQAQRTQRNTDNAFEYGIDQAQRMFGKGVEVAGDLVGSSTIKDFGSGIVATQDQDIAAGGYQPTYTKSLRETFSDGGISSAIGWLAEKTAENAASGGVAIAGTAAAALTAPFSAPAAAVLGGGTLVASGVMGAGETAFEMEDKTGTYDSRVAAGAGLIIAILDKAGAGKVIPKDKIASMTGEEIVEKLLEEGSPSAIKAATEIGGRIAKAGVGEGVTEGAQQGTSIGATALTGGEYTGQEIADSLIDSAAVGTSIGGASRTAIETGTGIGKGAKFFFPQGYTPTDSEAAADVASMLETVATEEGYDLNNVSNNMDAKGARAAVDVVHTRISSDINEGMADVRTELKSQDTDTDEVKADKEAVRRAARSAKTKTKSTVTNADMEATERLLGGSAEGQRLIKLFRQSNELTELNNRGLKGGVSRITDQASPLPTDTGYSNTAAIQLPTRLGITGALAAGTGGSNIPLQLGAVAAGRGIDALTGRRSRVAKFVRDQQGNQGIQPSDAPSLRGQRALAKAQQEQERLQKQEDLKQSRREAAQRGDPAVPGSPQDTVEQATGLDRRGVADMVTILERTNKNKIVQRSINDFRKSVYEGGRVEGLNELIRAIKGLLANNPSLDARRVREPVRGNEVPVDTRKIESGKTDNQKEVERLKDEVNADRNIKVLDKAILGAVLTEFGLNLGTNPVETALDLVEGAKAELSAPKLADKYLMPYVKRIQRQQNAKFRKKK